MVKESKMVRKIILLIVSSIFLIYAFSFIYTKWKNTHGWLFNVVYSTGDKSKVIDSFIVVDTNFKSAQFRAEEYLRQTKKYPAESRVEFVRHIGRMPWRKFGIHLPTG